MIEKIKENWDKILLTLKEEHEISNISYSTWLEPLKPHSFKDNKVTIIVPEQTFLQYVNKKYGFLLKVTISEFLEKECEVDFKVKEQIEEAEEPSSPQLIKNNKALVSPDVIQSANLNPKYIDDNFTACSDIRRLIKTNFDAAGISIPYRHVHVVTGNACREPQENGKITEYGISEETGISETTGI